MKGGTRLIVSSGFRAVSGRWSRATALAALGEHRVFTQENFGDLIPGTCEAAACDAGFVEAELLATLAGEPLYLASGWHEIERTAVPTSLGIDVPAVWMGERQCPELGYPFATRALASSTAASRSL